MKIERDVALAPLTTLKVGGPARFFARARRENDVIDAFEHARRNSLDVFVLGGGSNLLVSDNGFDGLVVQIVLKGMIVSFAPFETKDADVAITVAAGEDWDNFVSYCVTNEFAGVECLSGIPGSVGGTPVQNVGAYGQEVSETIDVVRCYDRVDREIVHLSKTECGFSYRTSIFNTVVRDRYVVLGVVYGLKRGGGPKIVYKDLKEHFGDRTPTLAETRQSVIEIRRAKSMVIDKADPNSRSAGSFFKNPIVSRSTFDAIADRIGDEKVPSFPADDDRVKIPAAWLIERSGFHKGYSLGNAGISTNHSLALVNLGGASAAEIVALKEKIEVGVLEKFDILLQPEPVRVGFD